MKITRFESFDAAQKDWQALEDERVYPFQQWWYLKLFAEHFCEVKDVYLLGAFDGDSCVAVAGFEKIGDVVMLLGMKPVLGGQEVTDYGGMLLKKGVTVEEVLPELKKYLREIGGKTLQLDYLREDGVLYAAVVTGRAKLEQQEVAPFIQVAEDWESYLADLPRVKRKELRRKIRRLEAEKSFHFCKEETFEQDFDDFIRLHRLSSSDKHVFMSEEMKQFFWKLVTADSYPWQHRFCFLSMEGKRVAAILSFISDTQSLLYNSGFDPDFNYYSVGLILKAYSLKNAIEEKRKIYDFLRGDERYKYDMGGKDVVLYRAIFDL